MSNPLQPVRGTHDWLPEDHRKFRHVVETARMVSERYGFAQMETPIFEFSDVFHRTLGDTSDVVTKETYTFTDRGNESVTLRPEFTAAIARAFVSNKLQDSLPIKWFYAGPAFRYERPQKGRLRQFHQFGCELLGVNEPEGDVETIALAIQILTALGLKDKITLEINTLGDSDSRNAYRESLVSYFTTHLSSLSEDSKTRLEKNPLRILDSKDEGDKKIVAGAPQLHDSLTPDARAFYDKVTSGLTRLGIKFTQNSRLVRGLDYYNHTVFECLCEGLGAQATVLAGGRYNQLIGMMGGAETQGVGFASGIERVLLALEAMQAQLPAPPRPIAVIPVGETTENEAWKLTQRLREQGFVVEQAYKGNMGKRMKKAASQNAAAAIILGDDELKNGTATVKHMDSGEQTSVSLNDVAAYLARLNS